MIMVYLFVLFCTSTASVQQLSLNGKEDHASFMFHRKKETLERQTKWWLDFYFWVNFGEYFLSRTGNGEGRNNRHRPSQRKHTMIQIDRPQIQYFCYSTCQATNPGNITDWGRFLICWTIPKAPEQELCSIMRSGKEYYYCKYYFVLKVKMNDGSIKSLWHQWKLSI